MRSPDASDFPSQGSGVFPNHHEDERADDATLVGLIQRIGNSDPAALDELLRTYGPALIASARRIVISHEVAREVVQDVFWDVWNERTTLSITRDIAAYLFWRTRTRALNVRRSEIATRHREARWAAEPASPQASENDGVSGITAADTRHEVRLALRHVPPRCREIFMLVWEEQLSYGEVAEQLGISVPTVRSQMSRALKQVIQRLKAGSG